jgi:hypothetical protein
MHGRPALPDRGSPRVRTAWRIVKSSAIAQGDEEAQAHDPVNFACHSTLLRCPLPHRVAFTHVCTAFAADQTLLFEKNCLLWQVWPG